MSIAAFAKGLLDLEGQLTPIVVSLVIKDSFMLDGLDNACIEMEDAKTHLNEMITFGVKTIHNGRSSENPWMVNGDGLFPNASQLLTELNMELKEPRRLIFGAIPVFCFLLLPLIYTEFLAFDLLPFHQWMQYLSNLKVSFDKTVDDRESLKFQFRRLVRGEDRANLESTGFACDTAVHSIVCMVDRLVRMDADTMTVHAAFNRSTAQDIEHVVRPYARQEDEDLLKYITPVKILHGNNTPPACRYSHGVPAVIFSTSGFSGNLFHEFNEIIIPLFITSRHFRRRVRFVAVDYKPAFFKKYRRIMSGLSGYEVMNPAENRTGHCFQGAVVGLKFHGNLALNSSEIPGGYSMLDFKRFLGQSYGLKINDMSEIEKPVVMLISRKKTRKFLNEDEMVRTMKELGFRVMVVTKPKRMSDLDKFAGVVNSCGVLVGTHGAGMANELFLPAGAVAIQVVPLGLEWASENYFGLPAAAMGVNYLEYKIEAEESSLEETYGRDHPVIVDPASVFAKGYQAARAVYIDGQDLKINIVRFRKTLVEALRLIGRAAPSSL